MDNQLAAPVLFMLVGLPGSGKTYLGHQLARRLKINYVSSSYIQAKIFPKAKLDANEQKAVHKMSLFLIEELASLGSSVVCDLSSQTVVTRDELRRLAKKYQLQPILIHQQVDKQTAWLRCQSRSLHKNKDRYLTSLSKKNFANLSAAVELPLKEEAIVVSGVHTFETQSQTVFRKLLEMRLLSNHPDSTKEIVKPGLINLISSYYTKPLQKNLTIALNSNLKLSEKN